MLVLCLSRPELIESRPEWPVTVALEPLGPAEVDALLERLAAPAETRVRLALAAAGNPLYAEELVAWVREGGDADDLPTSLNALLGARLDRLEGAERAALERGAIEGELFHHGAVVELSGNKAITEEIDGLTRKDLIRAAAATFAGELVAYRFKHILVRDAAYHATTKKLRATLHERFAEWLEAAAGERVGEYHEILGYHLEQAHRYRTDSATPTRRSPPAPPAISQPPAATPTTAAMSEEPPTSSAARPPFCLPRASSGSSSSFPTRTRSASPDDRVRARRSPRSSTNRRPLGESGALRRMRPCAVSKTGER